ncbi:MAG: glucosyl-3-phosphoglycerate synthase [Pseudomonadota bacterium]
MTDSHHQTEPDTTSTTVDRWFAENTYHANEFADLQHLVALKKAQGVTISLALPALNEEKTIGHIIRTAQQACMEQVPLLDEIVLMDSNSTDRTREIAHELNVPVYIHQDVLPEYGARTGKGEALWKSVHVTSGDLIIWVDTDITNFHPHFIYGLVGALLHREETGFAKGFYRRPLQVGDTHTPGGGGRVTELTARPLLNLFYPALAGIIQPLSGEYGGRREILEQLTFTSGYGVETSLLIDIYEKFGLNAIAQINMEERIHHNQPLHNLSKMAFAITQTVCHRLARRTDVRIPDLNKTLRSVCHHQGQISLQTDQIAEAERPPLSELPEYRRQHHLHPSVPQ